MQLGKRSFTVRQLKVEQVEGKNLRNQQTAASRLSQEDGIEDGETPIFPAVSFEQRKAAIELVLHQATWFHVNFLTGCAEPTSTKRGSTSSATGTTSACGRERRGLARSRCDTRFTCSRLFGLEYSRGSQHEHRIKGYTLKR